MKRILSLVVLMLLLSGCGDGSSNNVIKFGISPDYPPFEYYENGKLVGFDVDLANLIAAELGKQADFRHIQFAAIFNELQNGNIDAGISAITVTDKRGSVISFSDEYYNQNIGLLYNMNQKIVSLSNKRIACQIGTVMELWLKEHHKDAISVTFDTNVQAIEALKSGRVDGMLIDNIQGLVFQKKYQQFQYQDIAEADHGYGIATKKDSDLTENINKVLKKIEKSGEMKKLKEKWLRATI